MSRFIDTAVIWCWESRNFEFFFLCAKSSGKGSKICRGVTRLVCLMWFPQNIFVYYVIFSCSTLIHSCHHHHHDSTWERKIFSIIFSLISLLFLAPVCGMKNDFLRTLARKVLRRDLFTLTICMQFCSHLLLSSAYRDYFSLSRQIKRNTLATLWVFRLVLGESVGWM